MADLQVKIMDNGPLFISGDVDVVDSEGNKFETKQNFALCRCGLSKNKPFCDGNHSGDAKNVL